MPTAAQLRGQLEHLVAERRELGEEMDVATEAGSIDRARAEDFRHRLEEIDARIFHLRLELAKTSET